MLSVPGGAHADGRLDGAARARARNLLVSALPPCLTGIEAALYATHVEACAVAASNNSYPVYIRTMARVVFNMASNGEHLVTEFPVSALSRLSHKVLHAETAHARRDKAVEARLLAVTTRAGQEAEKAKELASSVKQDSAIRCPSCKTQDGIHRTGVQTSHGDEGMKTCCLCAACGMRWSLKD